MKTKSRAILAALVMTSSAIAPMTSFAGAAVYRDNYDSGMICSTTVSQDGSTFCFREKGTWSKVDTPSGNSTYSLKGSVYSSVSFAGSVSQTTTDTSEKMLFKSGEPHNTRSSTTINILNSFSGQCVTYTIEYDLGFANGNVTQNNYTVTPASC